MAVVSTFPTGPFTTPFVSAPFTVPSPWNSLALTLDIVQLIGAMRVLIEYSVDGGATWSTLFGETGVVGSINPQTSQPRTRETLASAWSRPWPAGLLRLTISGPSSWACAGGQLDLS